MTDWSDLETAVVRHDWPMAVVLVRSLAAEWRAVRGFLELFAGPDADVAMQAIDDAMAGMVAALEVDQVDPEMAEKAVSRLRALLILA